MKGFVKPVVTPIAITTNLTKRDSALNAQFALRKEKIAMERGLDE